MKHESDLEQKILKEAEKLFMEKGFSGTKTTDIAAKVGCNHALIHYYFRSKQNLFEKVFANKFSIGINQLTINLDNVENIEQLTENIITQHLELVLKNSKLPLFILNELNSNPKRIDFLQNLINDYPLFNEFYLKLDAILQKEVKKGTIRNIDGLTYMLNIISLTIATVVMLPIYSNAVGLDKKMQKKFLEMRRDEIAKLVLNGILRK